MAAGGVRTHVSRPAQPPRLVRKRVKAFEAFITSARSGGTAPVDFGPSIAPETATNAPSATELLDEIPDAPLPSPAPPPNDKPTGDVAPPIDWDQPFG